MSYSKRIAFTFLIGVLAFFFGYALAIHPMLPDRVTAHFSIKRDTGNLVPKEHYTLWVVVFQFGLATLFSMLAILLKYFPDSMIGLPNKRYWLAEERRDATLDISGTFLVWIAAVNATLIFAIIFISDQVNLEQIQKPALAFWLSTAIYGLIIIVMTLGFTSLFFRVPADTSNNHDGRNETTQ